MSSSNKWKIYNTTPLCNILNVSACVPIWYMARKKLNNLSTKKEDYKYQDACVSYLNLKQNKAFKEKVYKYLST